MNKIFYPLFLAVACCMWFKNSRAQLVNTNISNAVTFDGEPYLAINPVNPQNMVAAWMGEKYSAGSFKIAITVRSSFDGGNTWSSAITLPHFSTTFGSADVSMAFDKTGLLYLCYIDFNQALGTGGDYVTRSTDGGLTWDTATEAISVNSAPGKLPIDRPWMVVDCSNTANAGTVYITSKPAYWVAPPNRNYYTLSIDSGHTWSPIANVDGGNYLVGNIIQQPMAAPSTTLNGNFCAVYPSYLSSQNIEPAYYFATSKNKGQTFSYSTVVVAPAAPVDTNLKSGYRLTANMVDSNQLVFATVDSSLGESDIYAYHSNDGGATWSGKVKVNDDAAGTGKDHDMVWAAYNEQGVLALTWRDRRNADTSGFWSAGYDFYYALSTDNGQTFSPNQKLSSQFIAFDSVDADKGNDFMTCVYHNDTLYTVWGDTRSGSMNIYFSKTIASSDSALSITLLQGDEPQWHVFPNPVVSVLNVEASSVMLGKEISVYDATGKKITGMQIQNSHFEFATVNWAPGNYFVKVENEIKKVVKP